MEHLNQTIERAAFVADRTIFFFGKKNPIEIELHKRISLKLEKNKRKE
jgi:hypothetical protein